MSVREGESCVNARAREARARDSTFPAGRESVRRRARRLTPRCPHFSFTNGLHAHVYSVQTQVSHRRITQHLPQRLYLLFEQYVLRRKRLRCARDGRHG